MGQRVVSETPGVVYTWKEKAGAAGSSSSQACQSVKAGRLAWSVKGVVWCVMGWGNWRRRKGIGVGYFEINHQKVPYISN